MPALLVFSAPALKCGARDLWIGWDYGVQFGRLHLVTNNARFLILPWIEIPNLGSRVNERSSLGGRTWFDWLPILDLSERQLFDVNRVPVGGDRGRPSQ